MFFGGFMEKLLFFLIALSCLHIHASENFDKFKQLRALREKLPVTPYDTTTLRGIAFNFCLHCWSNPHIGKKLEKFPDLIPSHIGLVAKHQFFQEYCKVPLSTRHIVEEREFLNAALTFAYNEQQIKRVKEKLDSALMALPKLPDLEQDVRDDYAVALFMLMDHPLASGIDSADFAKMLLQLASNRSWYQQCYGRLDELLKRNTYLKDDVDIIDAGMCADARYGKGRKFEELLRGDE